MTGSVDNVIIGNKALQDARAGTTTKENVVIGSRAFSSSIGPSGVNQSQGNVVIGTRAATGTAGAGFYGLYHCVVIGNDANPTTNSNWQIVIGADAVGMGQLTTVLGSIGNTQQTYIYGQQHYPDYASGALYANDTTAYKPLVINSSGDVRQASWFGGGGGAFSLTNDATLLGSSFNGTANVSDWGIDLANANTWTGKITVTDGATNAGERHIGVTSNPSSLSAGDIWFRTDENKYHYYDGSTDRKIVAEALTQTLTNKTVIDNSFTIADDGDNTKLIAFQISSISTSTTRTWTFPDVNGTFARSDAAQTFTGVQTFSSAPVLSTGTVTVSGVTITFPTSAATLATLSLTETLTNKRINKRTGSTASSATPTINTDNVDEYYITALTVDITSMTTNLSGTPVDGQTLEIDITGTATRNITWGASFEASSVAIPTSTSGTSKLSTFWKWNSATTKWRIASYY